MGAREEWTHGIQGRPYARTENNPEKTRESS